MDREDLKDVIQRVLDKLRQAPADERPIPACVFDDGPCDTTTRYAIDEED